MRFFSRASAAAAHARLASFFGKPISTSKDADGLTYVSSVEAASGIPFFGAQFHPEKTQFEWTPMLQIPHGPAAVDVSLGLAKVLVAEARKSTHSPASYADEADLLIYNYAPTFTGREKEVEFEQIYFFQ